MEFYCNFMVVDH